MSKLVGLFLETAIEKDGAIYNRYLKAVESLGAIPIVLPYVENADTLLSYVNLCDGFLFSGGGDINPQRYNQNVKSTCGEIHYKRDELEFNFFNLALQSNKPILAICRGAQLINVALGGSLYQDIEHEYKTDLCHRQSEAVNMPSHSVNVLPDTPLSNIVSSVRIVANSFHHQALKQLGMHLTPMALADDGIIEAVYLSGKQYLRAYQWHPERLCDTDSDNKIIFFDFIKSCSI